MSAKKSADSWFADYGASHRDHTNERIHWVCVPLIFFSVLGFIWSIPTPDALAEEVPGFNRALIAIFAAPVFHVRLLPRLGAGLLFFMAMGDGTIAALDLADGFPVWEICAGLFVLA